MSTPLDRMEKYEQHDGATRVSVVVACRNEILRIGEFLDALLRQELGHIEMEVVIADGMSEDGTRKVLREFERKFAIVRVIDNPEKIAATGLNRAIRESRGEIIVRMDAHTIYASDYVRSCVEVLRGVGAENVGGPARTIADGYFAQAIALAFHAPFATGGAKYRDPRYRGPVSTVPYGCWRKSTLERFGLFDPELVRGQDDELNFRIISAGGTVWQSPRIVSWYRPRTNLVALFRQQFQSGYWKVAAFRKHGRPLSWRNIAPTSCLIAGAVLPICAVVARMSGSRTRQDDFLSAWIALFIAYAVSSFAAAVSIAGRNKWKFLPLLPVVFATYHVSYAFGFLLAALRPPSTQDCTNLARKGSSAVAR
jgi:glycosyltransferase involved in cell wall biosynthesis